MGADGGPPAGELEIQQGTVWKHPNLRMAYVAQHAFHHIEEHLDMTANQYIQWRYAFGEDRAEQARRRGGAAPLRRKQRPRLRSPRRRVARPQTICLPRPPARLLPA